MIKTYSKVLGGYQEISNSTQVFLEVKQESTESLETEIERYIKVQNTEKN